MRYTLFRPKQLDIKLWSIYSKCPARATPSCKGRGWMHPAWSLGLQGRALGANGRAGCLSRHFRSSADQQHQSGCAGQLENSGATLPSLDLEAGQEKSKCHTIVVIIVDGLLCARHAPLCLYASLHVIFIRVNPKKKEVLLGFWFYR